MRPACFGRQRLSSLPRPIIPAIVGQHVEDAIVLHGNRTSLVRAPHVQLHHLRRFDDRLAGHLDGLSIAGEHAWPFCAESLGFPSASAVFVAAIRELGCKELGGLDRLFALVEAVPDTRNGLLAAFGWIERKHLQGIVSDLIASADPFRRLVGVAACAMHRVDLGIMLPRLLQDPNPEVRARTSRTAGELGKRELLSTMLRAVNNEDPGCRRWAAWSAVLLGDRQNGLDFLENTARYEGSFQPRALQLSLQALDVAEAHSLLSRCAEDPTQQRNLIQGTGFVGDPSFCPWLISLMADDRTARLAGEAFCFITGADLALLDLERKPPDDISGGPDDDPNDPHVEMDPDENLPWPDTERVQSWWNQNGGRFSAGTRHLVGAPITRSHCLDVLRSGYQPQRIAAALHLCLLAPGTALFEWRAPAWRQQTVLAQMS